MTVVQMSLTDSERQVRRW